MSLLGMCVTKYLSATDHRQARVKATHCTTGRSITINWDNEHGELTNHRLVAKELFYDREPEFYTSVKGGGYVFGRSCESGVLDESILGARKIKS